MQPSHDQGCQGDKGHSGCLCGQRPAGEADCKSMLDILSLALPAEGEFTVFATGPDAREAVTAAASLLETPGD